MRTLLKTLACGLLLVGASFVYDDAALNKTLDFVGETWPKSKKTGYARIDVEGKGSAYAFPPLPTYPQYREPYVMVEEE